MPDKLCPNGHGLVAVGKKLAHEELHFRPAKLYLERIYTTTYKCPSCELMDGLAHLIQSQAPKALIPLFHHVHIGHANV
ncbi:IS66 family transposase zinc-finger binding domain-containing protein [Lactiplantibacillus nangangensis]|uniref:IS66 family transposase zinc-finger binding domain-containing protein n=1 Tax=Lactiplantibacillus nangangensis TaxID=2559917 RepID=A0ABW1SH46_9LACO